MQKQRLTAQYALQNATSLSLPHRWQELPEKVLQFGTGVLLKGLPDYLIDLANRAGKFNGRIVQIKSTAKGSAAGIQAQDGLFTLVEQSVANGAEVQQISVISSISRTLEAHHDWEAIKQVATSAHLEVVISNTTEVGLMYEQEEVLKRIPHTFPGKLAALLYYRYLHFNGAKGSGLVIIPCELIPDNARILKEAIVKHGKFNEFLPGFYKWLEQENVFCNALVDKIVPGKPSPEAAAALAASLDYEDTELIVAELYALWAIEYPENAPRPMPAWSEVHPNWILAQDITMYRERKLRLLNGTHTAMVGLALLCGYKTVSESLSNKVFYRFVKDLMLHEIVPNIPVEHEAAENFAWDVLARFQNPFVEHYLINITLQYISKMNMRNVPTILQYIKQHHQAPKLMALGFAGMLAFMQPEFEREGKFYKTIDGKEVELQDTYISFLYKASQDFGGDARQFTVAVMSNRELWGDEFAENVEFMKLVATFLKSLTDKPATEVIAELYSQE
jgi:tagaturonate reductase